MISNEEIEFFKIIKDDCKIIFDIGCREDVEYLKICSGKEFHLFEPNPIFLEKCMKNADDFLEDNVVYFNNYGIGSENTSSEYFIESQSFFKRDKHFNHKKEPVRYTIKKFSDYIKIADIKEIDFLKIDTEGYEVDILTDDINFITKNVKNIQFEFASTWYDREKDYSLISIYNIFKDYFHFYFLRDLNHPLSKKNVGLLTEIKNETDVSICEYFAKKNYGFNIIMSKDSMLFFLPEDLVSE